MQTTVKPVAKDYRFSKPSKENGADVWTLVKSTGVLDVNSSYSYVMWCEFFRETSVVVERNDRVVGFISGYIKPESPNILFIWQVAVDDTERGQGLATKMLRHLLERSVCKDVRYLEATVAPSNMASRKLFTRFADKMGAPCEVHNCFTANDFPGEGHEDEPIYHIGPFNR
ncbi:MAG TPA: diaminobutyrate acetyltransferase [Bacillales bacterium]